jgi:hypothetical protein
MSVFMTSRLRQPWLGSFSIKGYVEGMPQAGALNIGGGNGKIVFMI